MDEHELKYMIDGEGYGKCIEALRRICGTCGDEKLLINYYYDTPDRALHKDGITLRVRQCGAEVQGQIKRHDKGLSTDSRESYFEVGELPSVIRFEGRKAKLLGSLVTKRTVFEHDGMEIDIDHVFYLGKSDHELEIEFPEGEEQAAAAFAASLGVSFLTRRGGKYSRFLKALKQTEKSTMSCDGAESD
ncbi:MAG: CYTH domain-containing protein [Clostridia bacterium]|nr:CYTH domain-containing protein [Clostridia bacterium]